MVLNLMKKYLLLSVASAFLLNGGQEVQASGFGLKLNSSKLVSRANAGSAVEADVLASFTNPANSIQNSGYHAAIMGTAIIPHVKFRGRTTIPVSLLITQNADSPRQVGKNAIVPAFGVSARLHDRLSFALWVGAPFGLKMNYGDKFGGRRYVIKSSMRTVNVNPSIAIKLHDMLSIGAGFQAQEAKVKLLSQVASSIPPINGLLDMFRTKQEIKGDDWAYGWTAGLLLKPLDCLKLGFSYRSRLKTHLRGKLRFSSLPPGPPALLAQLADVRAKANLKFPNIFTLSGSLDITKRWTVLFDVIRTNWSSIKNIIIRTPGNPVRGLIQQKWRDSWFFSGGLDFKAKECWVIHAGVGYDQTPTRTKYRVPGIPDSNKWWLALGTSVEITNKVSMTLGIGEEIFKKAPINLKNANPGNAGKGNLKGRIREHVELVTLQFNVKI
jgi:long-chain fatty acid transport protein